MKTLLFITRYELKNSLKKRSILIYGLIIFSITFLIVNTFAGAFDSIQIMIGGENNKLNSQSMLSLLYTFINMIGLIILAVIVGKMALKDVEYNAWYISYTLPVSKLTFLSGKFLAACITNMFVFACAVLGVLVATVMPYLDPVQFGSINLKNYLFPFLIIIVPNVFFLSAIFFSLASTYRNYYINWLAIILLYGVYYGVSQLAHKPEFSYLAGILDPFGFQALNSSQVGLSSDQLNNTTATSNNVVFFNRLFWSIIGLVSCIFAYFRFSFQSGLKKRKRKNPKQTGAEQIEIQAKDVQPKKPVQTLFNTTAWIKQFFFLVQYEWSLLFKNLYFRIILLIGLVLLGISSLAIGEIYDTNTYPVAYNVADVLLGATKLFMFILITIFSGEMLWRDRSLNTHYVGDALPLASTVKFFSKVTSLTVFVFFAHIFFVALGLLIQYLKGYTNYELSLLIQLIVGIGFTSVLFTIGLSFAIQATVKNRFIGYFIMLAYFSFQFFFAGSVLEDNTFKFNSAPFIQYSDMNGFGYNMSTFVLFKTYWLLLVVLLLVLANTLYPSGIDIGFKTRLSELKKHFQYTPRFRVGVITLFIAFIFCGSFIYYNIHGKNYFESTFAIEKKMVEYEKNFREYKNKVNPVITDVSIHTELYPENGSLQVNGRYWLKNISNIALSEIAIGPAESDSVWFSVAGKWKVNTPEFGVYQMQTSLIPGDSLQLHFLLNDTPQGFTNQGVRSYIDKNGTFFNNDIFPVIGYNEGFELQANSRRRKHELKEKTQFAKSMDDAEGIAQNILGHQGLINLNITAGTSSDQTVIAPGELVDKWTENGRNYFKYTSQRPINNFYSILSADYDSYRDVWKSSDSTNTCAELTVYHHPGHTYNLNTMMNAMKESLSYYRQNFSPFQYSHLRIVEFPRYISFAQSFPGCIPFSEDIGFIADLREVNLDNASVLNEADVSIDYPFYVTAHEVAHQWWAHQVCAANVEGGAFIIETLSQYSALMVMKHHYGEDKMRKFLTYEAFQYLSSRSGGMHAEKPLLTVAGDEQFVFYRKGSVVMYALQDYLGENVVNDVLSRFIEKYAFKNATYPTSRELVNEFDKVTPDSLKYIINDWFRDITLYDNKLQKATYVMNDDLEYNIDFIVSINKYKYNEDGKETTAMVNDYIPFAVYNSKDEQVYFEKIKVKSGENKISIKLDRRPETLVLDPYNILLDKDWLLKKVKVKSANTDHLNSI